MTSRRQPGTTEGLDPALNARIVHDGPPVKPVTAKAGVCTRCGHPTDTDSGWCRACLAREDEHRGQVSRHAKRASERPAVTPRDVSALVAERDEMNRAMAESPALRTPENYRRRDRLNDRIGVAS